ncbi:MAG: membrane protein insertion efficiency factor YidD [Bdellovibrionales bacterium]|nr:membrane protein insertion efficiency factor YidD [Bdellovibrionales bacterium]
MGFLKKFRALAANILANLSSSLIVFYQVFLSYIFGGNCRFYPTCSCYAKEAFHKYGFFTAFAIVLKRIISCRPFGRHGYDPVPEVKFNV